MEIKNESTPPLIDGATSIRRLSEGRAGGGRVHPSPARHGCRATVTRRTARNCAAVWRRSAATGCRGSPCLRPPQRAAILGRRAPAVASGTPTLAEGCRCHVPRPLRGPAGTTVSVRPPRLREHDLRGWHGGITVCAAGNPGCGEALTYRRAARPWPRSLTDQASPGQGYSLTRRKIHFNIG